MRAGSSDMLIFKTNILTFKNQRERYICSQSTDTCSHSNPAHPLMRILKSSAILKY